MTLLILIMLLGFCLTIDVSIGYDEAEDQRPGNIFHRMIRKFHSWIFDGEDVVHT